jgi:CobQ-like glutamine amidotransferase family enzyme
LGLQGDKAAAAASGQGRHIICMMRRLQWRGIGVSVTELPVGEAADFAGFDLFFIGGGQDFEQELIMRDLAAGKGRELRAAAADGKTFLAVCGGFQMLGNYYRTWDGVQLDYLGIADFYTVGAKKRMIGNFAFRCGEASGGSIVLGFENHSGRTWLGEGVQPLGCVLLGYGNNGEDGTEGVRSGNVFGTYSHGPVLPKNPALCDHILLTALRQKYGAAELEPLPDAEEDMAREACLRPCFYGRRFKTRVLFRKCKRHRF